MMKSESPEIIQETNAPLSDNIETSPDLENVTPDQEEPKNAVEQIVVPAKKKRQMSEAQKKALQTAQETAAKNRRMSALRKKKEQEDLERQMKIIEAEKTLQTMKAEKKKEIEQRKKEREAKAALRKPRQRLAERPRWGEAQQQQKKSQADVSHIQRLADRPRWGEAQQQTGTVHVEFDGIEDYQELKKEFLGIFG
ncbi:hypothetical protein DFS34DRAFT_645849 [Phlyctochytrium arcticum]|nr:hypothetical protein DFS34DRAFT_645849 [Phlyctochytrium arcticum]